MDYYELRKLLTKIIPRRTVLDQGVFGSGAVKEKGRKSNYFQFDLEKKEMLKNERLLKTDEIESFVEVSIRASACPMPLNIDVYDGLRCGFGCKYCFADNFRASLYTAFFDNSKTMGLRHCNVDFYRTEMDKLLPHWGEEPSGDEVQRAICKGVPIRFGIRFEDFLPIEGKKQISLALLNYLADANYPVMINTKSDLVMRDDYVRALADNDGKAAVHVTLISSNNKILKKLEPGAPSYEKRLATLKTLSDAGIRAVARIEPYMVFINDEKEDVERYIEDVWETGCRHMTFDTYHYPSGSAGIRRSYHEEGYDFARMFLLTSDSQAIGSLLLGKFMDLFRAKGFECSTFDLGNSTTNDDSNCCCVSDYFEDKTETGYNAGSAISAIRFILDADGAVTWSDYRDWVKTDMGGFLSPGLEKDLHLLWNSEGNTAFQIDWAQGIVPVGYNEDGMIWKFDKNEDHRQRVLEGLTT